MSLGGDLCYSVYVLSISFAPVFAFAFAFYSLVLFFFSLNRRRLLRQLTTMTTTILCTDSFYRAMDIQIYFFIYTYS